MVRNGSVRKAWSSRGIISSIFCCREVGKTPFQRIQRWHHSVAGSFWKGGIADPKLLPPKTNMELELGTPQEGKTPVELDLKSWNSLDWADYPSWN